MRRARPVPSGSSPNKLSGVRDDRAGPDSLIDYVRAGDTVVAIALDRLGRSLSSVISARSSN